MHPAEDGRDATSPPPSLTRTSTRSAPVGVEVWKWGKAYGSPRAVEICIGGGRFSKCKTWHLRSRLVPMN